MGIRDFRSGSSCSDPNARTNRDPRLFKSGPKIFQSLIWRLRFRKREKGSGGHTVDTPLLCGTATTIPFNNSRIGYIDNSMVYILDMVQAFMYIYEYLLWIIAHCSYYTFFMIYTLFI